MKIEICGRGIYVSDELREHIERRIRFALLRFEERVPKLRVRLSDLNGPRGGTDKSCLLTATIRPTSTLIIEARSENMYAAINCVVDRASTCLVRRIKRSSRQGRAERIVRYRSPKPSGTGADGWRQK